MRDYVSGFLGQEAKVHSKIWGDLTFESARLTDAADGDLVVHIGDPSSSTPPVIRIQSECVFAEVFASDLCDCAEQLQLAMERLSSSEYGLLFYLRFDGRGAGLAAKVAATSLEVKGVDTWESRVRIGVEPESRRFSLVAEYLITHGHTEVRLLTNNPDKVEALTSHGIKVSREPLLVAHPSPAVLALYTTKASKFGHHIVLSDFGTQQVRVSAFSARSHVDRGLGLMLGRCRRYRW